MKIFLKVSCIMLIGIFVACKKDTKNNTPTPDPTPVDASKGSVKILFENLVDTLPLVFNQKYVNPKGDTFNVSKFNYFISNIKLIDNSNLVYSETESYHCIKHSIPSSGILTLTNVPVGSYKSISFLLGVDSARNCSGSQTGGLDPAGQASDMFWTWSSGYIMFKLEGTAPKSTAVGNSIEYHIGGYGGVNKTQRNFNFSFAGSTANVTAAATPTIHMIANLNEFFKTPTLIDFITQNTTVSGGTNAKMFADNYSDIFLFKNIHN